MRITKTIEERDQDLMAIDAGHGDQDRRGEVEDLLAEALAVRAWNAEVVRRSLVVSTWTPQPTAGWVQDALM